MPNPRERVGRYGPFATFCASSARPPEGFRVFAVVCGRNTIALLLLQTLHTQINPTVQPNNARLLRR